MSSTVKAGIFSVCLIAIVIAVIYFRFGTPGDLAFQSETTPAEVVQGETGEHAQPAATAQPSANIQLPPRKGEIVLNVKVIDAQTGRTIPKARLRVFRATLGSGSSTE
ncbi:MAG TPA: hypothetical protein VK116_16845, partial [Planctomycetota bacterium]|nr:hypothetical protein [Planctomycetota bacterium]